MKLIVTSLLLLAPLSPAGAQAPPPAPEPASAPEALARPYVLGASVSHGYGLRTELMARVSFAEILQACLVPPAEFRRESSTFFFDAPVKTGEAQVDEAVAAKPTLVFAVDFLFWYGAGRVAREEQRLARLELGLAQLERLDVPIVISDFPDVRPALRGKGPFGGPIISASQVPADETRKKLNERVRAWAKERGNVAVVPLESFLERLHAGGALSVRTAEWPPEAAATMLQEDLLHPTSAGTVGLALLALDAALGLGTDLKEDDVRWDPAAVRAVLDEATAEERERNLERERRREERRREREEREKGPDQEGGGGAVEKERRAA